MPQHYAEAERMLGVTDNKIFGPADHMLKKMGEAVGVGHTFKPTRVATFFPPEGEEGGKTYPTLILTVKVQIVALVPHVAVV